MDYSKMPIINWDALMTLNRAPHPVPKPEDGSKENYWEHAYANYNRMIQLEKQTTTEILDYLPLLPTDTVIDCCCGPGRITMQLAGRVKAVTAIDSAHNMLETCKKNCAALGHTNVTFLERDSFTAEVGKDFDKFDVVVSSRSGGERHLDKLLSYTKRLLVFQGFANSPCLPEIFGAIFRGCSDREIMDMSDQSDRRISYNIFYNKLYDMGFEPNLRVIPDCFTGVFPNKEVAYEYIRLLGKVDPDKEDVYRANMDKCLTANADGTVTFHIETRASLIWFEVNPKRFY